jgi:hypothetical protein
MMIALDRARKYPEYCGEAVLRLAKATRQILCVIGAHRDYLVRSLEERW